MGSTYYVVAQEFPHWTNPELDQDSKDFLKNLEKFRNMPYYQKQGLYVSGPSGFVGPHVGGELVRVSYYQYVPIVIVTMALLFFLPFYMWKENVQRSGIHLVAIMKGASDISKIHDVKDNAMLSNFVTQFRCYVGLLSEDKKPRRIFQQIQYILCIGMTYRNSLFCYYVFIKLVYIGNIVLQLFILSSFFGMEGFWALILHSYGVLLKIATDQYWDHSRLFPMSTVCHFTTSRDGEHQPFTVECTLPINIFNDKIFTIIVLLYQVLLIATLLSILRWFYVSSERKRILFIRAHLKQHHDTGVTKTEESLLNILHRDAVFILQLIEMNVSGVVVSSILSQLYSELESERKRRFKPGTGHSLLRADDDSSTV